MEEFGSFGFADPMATSFIDTVHTHIGGLFQAQGDTLTFMDKSATPVEIDRYLFHLRTVFRALKMLGSYKKVNAGCWHDLAGYIARIGQSIFSDYVGQINIIVRRLLCGYGTPNMFIVSAEWEGDSITASVTIPIVNGVLNGIAGFVDIKNGVTYGIADDDKFKQIRSEALKRMPQHVSDPLSIGIVAVYDPAEYAASLINSYREKMESAKASAEKCKSTIDAAYREMIASELEAAKVAETLANLITYRDRLLGETQFSESVDLNADIAVMLRACKNASKAGGGDHAEIARGVFAARKAEFSARHAFSGRQVFHIFTNKVRDGHIIAQQMGGGKWRIGGQTREAGANGIVELGSNLHIYNDHVYYRMHADGERYPYLFWVTYSALARRVDDADHQHKRSKVV